MNNKKHNNLSFIYLLLTLAGLVIFRAPLAILIDNLLVQPIFSKITSSLATDLALLSTLTILIYLLWNKKDHKWILKYTGALLILFVMYRFDGNWLYTHSYLLKRISQLTYIDLSAISVGVLFIRHGYKLRTEKQDQEQINNNGQSGFIEDNSIEEEKYDTFERLEIAKQIAYQINATDNRQAFAIGITGTYGSGKTSFLNLISITLKKEVHAPLIVHFNPWDANTSVNIQKFFFDELSAVLAKEDSALSSRLYSYYRRLNDKNTFIGDLINNLRDLFVVFDRKLDDEKTKINEMMKDLPRKVIIIIDDLDRLHNEEVIEVLRLIRNTANFRNIIYLVAYDRQYVEHSIKALNEGSYKNYLDKIFQIEIPLPKSESYIISNALIEKLQHIIKPEELNYVRDQFVLQNFDSDYDEAISAVFNNKRDVVRFVNSFSIAYKMISDEVDFVQLLFIQILKFRYPDAYSTLYDQRKEVLAVSDSPYLNTKSYSLRKDPENSSGDYIILKLLKNDLAPYDLTQIRYILNHLFSLNLTLRYKDKTRTITNPEVFDLFFTGRLSSIGLSESAFVQNISKDVKEIETYVDEQLKAGKHKPLLHRILAIKTDEIIDKDHYEQVWYIFVQKVVPAYISKEGFGSIPFDKFIFIHFDYANHIITKYYLDNIEEYGNHLKKLLSFHKESYIFISEIARKLIVRNGKTNIFTKDYFLQIQLDCLIKGLENNPSTISPELVWLFWGIREYHSINREFEEKYDQEITWNIHPKAIEILRLYLNTKDLRHLLQSLIYKDMNSEGEYCLHDKLIEDVFKDRFWLKELLKSNEQTDADIKNEFWKFMNKYELANKSVEFEFKKLNIN